ncbi:U2 small nuclear ribonucleoprotein auxiliary factor 35 kDa subunit- protein 2 [Dinochytrium kinnereticum]|nr:U2 small nuclear ribonucleoprotein auxiliary factor 35 kDa subunit- protein 2 [Dinochytrium kinnereticum]
MSRNSGAGSKAPRQEGKMMTLSKHGGYEVHTLAPTTEIKEQQQQGREHCAFYTKVGACRYGDQCGRGHFRPVGAKVIMIPNMHQDPLLIPIGGLEELSDSLDAPDEEELQKRFEEFFEDAHPEFAAVGKIVQFKVCRNMVPHLRGNVFVQYSTEQEAAKAVEIFDGRFFGGRRLSCELVPVSSWKTAICGVYDRRKCPKGDACNFLHVFNNPKNMYREADFDWEPPKWALSEKDNERENDRETGARKRSRHVDHTAPSRNHSRSHRDSEKDRKRGRDEDNSDYSDYSSEESLSPSSEEDRRRQHRKSKRKSSKRDRRSSRHIDVLDAGSPVKLISGDVSGDALSDASDSSSRHSRRKKHKSKSKKRKSRDNSRELDSRSKKLKHKSSGRKKEKKKRYESSESDFSDEYDEYRGRSKSQKREDA